MDRKVRRQALKYILLDHAIHSIEGSTAESEIPAPSVLSSVTDIIVATEVDDWRTPLIKY